MYKPTILIDLDGVLNEYGKEKFNENYIPDMKKGAKEFLEKLSQKAELKLFTTRNLLLATKWLINNDIDKYFSDVTNIKSMAYLHIDDRAICFQGDYKQTLNNIENFKVYWKN
ncbi:hypothetical protein J6S88_00025 [bacterium]|nr:hypothetical protein [bacterium]